MRTWVCLGIAILGCGVVLAQNEQGKKKSAFDDGYVPVVPQSPTVVGGGGWGGGYHASTAAEGAARGMADVVRSAGDYNLATSAAAINMTEAQRRSIENSREFTDAYFDLREVNRKARAAERGPRLTQEELIRIAQSGAPKPLSTSQLDPLSGRLAWPALLTADEFAKGRQSVDQLFARRAQYGGLGFDELQAFDAAVQALMDELGAVVAQVKPQDYTQAKRFLQSLASEARKPAA